MTVLAFDTYARIKQLVQAGVPEAQAEAFVNVVAGATVLPDVSQLATKPDLALLESNLRGEMKALEGRLDGQIKGLKGELIWWILGAVGFTAAFPQVLAHLPK